jgi:hypothetical protein
MGALEPISTTLLGNVMLPVMLPLLKQQHATKA